MKKVTILQITNSLELGGVERNLHNICKYLNYGLFNHVVVSLFKSGSYKKYIDHYAKTTFLDGNIDLLEDVIVSNLIDVVIIHRAGMRFWRI